MTTGIPVVEMQINDASIWNARLPFKTENN